MDEQRVLSVSELNRSARQLLEEGLGDVWIKGEVSEASRAPSGHVYFTLRDAEAEVAAVRFRGRSPLLAPLAPGMVVLAYGRLTVYEPRGRYQFIATVVQPVGAGHLQAAFERLKEKLRAEGLFDPAHKRALPRFPLRLAVVTSPAGAAIRDILSALERRWPIAHVVLFPAAVQGETAPSEIVEAIERVSRYAQTAEPIDIVIVGRGGGSSEDLAAFNDEAVARAIHLCSVPIIAAVGHEVDVSIADFVADVRAPTPSTAVELATPDAGDVLRDLRRLVERTRDALAARVARAEVRLQTSTRVALFREPLRRLETCEQRMDGSVVRIVHAVATAVATYGARLTHVDDVLRLSDPRRPLERGYSITTREGETRPLRDAADVAPGQVLRTVLAKGQIRSTVEERVP